MNLVAPEDPEDTPAPKAKAKTKSAPAPAPKRPCRKVSAKSVAEPDDDDDESDAPAEKLRKTKKNSAGARLPSSLGGRSVTTNYYNHATLNHMPVARLDL